MRNLPSVEDTNFSHLEKHAETIVLIAESYKNGSNRPAVITSLNFFIWGITYLLMNLSYIYNTDGRGRSAVVTHTALSDYQMINPDGW